MNDRLRAGHTQCCELVDVPIPLCAHLEGDLCAVIQATAAKL